MEIVTTNETATIS